MSTIVLPSLASKPVIVAVAAATITLTTSSSSATTAPRCTYDSEVYACVNRE